MMTAIALLGIAVASAAFGYWMGLGQFRRFEKVLAEIGKNMPPRIGAYRDAALPEPELQPAPDPSELPEPLPPCGSCPRCYNGSTKVNNAQCACEKYREPHAHAQCPRCGSEWAEKLPENA